MAIFYALIKDETDYNGDYEVIGIFSTLAKAEAKASWEEEKAKDWAESMNTCWVPQFIIEKAPLDE